MKKISPEFLNFLPFLSIVFLWTTCAFRVKIEIKCFSSTNIIIFCMKWNRIINTLYYGSMLYKVIDYHKINVNCFILLSIYLKYFSKFQIFPDDSASEYKYGKSEYKQKVEVFKLLSKLERKIFKKTNSLW